MRNRSHRQEVKTITEYITANTSMPPFFPYPRFLLKMDLSQTAKLLYALLLDRSTLSQKNGWQDNEGRTYIVYPIAEIAEILDKSTMTIQNSLKELDIAVALRIDQSASMKAHGRLESAKRAAVAVYEFCAASKIPLLIYGDTADRSPIERMTMYSYIDWEAPKLNDKYSLMAIQSHSNNRDGMALKILSEKLIKAPQTTKLLISISDGQPKAMPDYTGNVAIDDMKQVISQYSRQGVLFLAAAIGQDKDAICDIYGQDRFIDISDLKQLPMRLVQIIARYL